MCTKNRGQNISITFAADIKLSEPILLFGEGHLLGEDPPSSQEIKFDGRFSNFLCLPHQKQCRPGKNEWIRTFVLQLQYWDVDREFTLKYRAYHEKNTVFCFETKLKVPADE